LICFIDPQTIVYICYLVFKDQLPSGDLFAFSPKGRRIYEMFV